MSNLDPSDALVFRNPILRGFNPDPSICVVPAADDKPATYFLTTSTFEYFPGCAIYTSTDLFTWQLIGHALTRRSQIELRTVEPGAGSWASTLRYREDEKRWYLATCLFQRYRPASDERIFPRGFYVYTDDIWDEKAWSDPVYFDNPGFDQDLFWDDDGKVFLSTTVRLAQRPPNSTQKDFAIHVSEIDLPTGRTLTPPTVIRSSPHGIAEGSHIIKRDGWYYLFTAEGGTEAGHQEWVFRSREGVHGPWEEQGQPLWYNGPDEEVQRTGHADIFEDGQGRWWAVLLGVRPLWDEDGQKWLEPQLGRETLLVKVDWLDDWPVFNEGRNITLFTQGRDPRLDSPEPSDETLVWKADLNRSDLEQGWYQKHTPLKQCYSLTERPGFLRLHGNAYELSSPEAPAMLLRKQTAYDQSLRVTLDFTPSRVGYEAGLVLWWNQYSYATVGVTLVELPSGEKVQTVVRRTPTTGPDGASSTDTVYPFLSPPEAPQEVSALLAQAPFQLELHCRGGAYVLGVQQGSERAYGTCAAAALTRTPPPHGGAFAGVLLGLYSFGLGEPVLDPADFGEIQVREYPAGWEQRDLEGGEEEEKKKEAWELGSLERPNEET